MTGMLGDMQTCNMQNELNNLLIIKKALILHLQFGM